MSTDLPPLQIGVVLDDPDRFEQTDEPAVDHTSKPLPPTYATPTTAPEHEEIFE